MILTNCRLVPALSDGISSTCGTVEIENGKIKSVCAVRSDVPDAIDCGGKTLLPGLIDLHTHIVILGGVGMDRLHDKMSMVVTAAKHATQYLDYGFTTIRDCGSTFRVANYVRQMVLNGSLEAPDIISCGLALMPTEVEPGLPMAQHLFFADGADEFQKATRTEIAAGAEFVKIFASGAAADPSGKPEQCIMTADEIRSVTETAVRKGRYVSAHCHSDDAVRLCVANGVHTIEHATLVTEPTLELALHTDSIVLIPTLAVMYISDGPRKAYWQARLGPMFDNCTKMMAKAYQSGAVIGFGTDCAAGSYEYENGIEFKFRRENCGMSDLDILLQATKINAKIAGIDSQLGEIKSGLRANLILVDGKPDIDISAMYQKPRCVWKDGRLVRSR